MSFDASWFFILNFGSFYTPLLKKDAACFSKKNQIDHTGRTCYAEFDRGGLKFVKGGIPLLERFEALEETKRKRILEAAFHEFAENGYEQASTNRIVKAAGIGKGMLFYYFENKESLYHYLIDYAIRVLDEHYLNKIDLTETDFIERLKKMAILKWEVFAEYETLGNFMATVGLNLEEPVLPQPLRSKIENMQAVFGKVMNDNIDHTKFRDDVDVQKAFDLIRWSMEGYRIELMEKFKGRKLTDIDMEPYWQDYYEYLDILKACFYKKGE